MSSPQSTPDDHSPKNTSEGKRRRSPAASALWIVVFLLFLICVGLSLYLFFRTPEIIQKAAAVATPGVTQDTSERAAYLAQQIALRRVELGDRVAAIDPPRCVAPAQIDENRLRLLRQQRGDALSLWRSLSTGGKTGATQAIPDTIPEPAVATALPGATPPLAPATPQAAPHENAPTMGIGLLRDRLEKASVIVLGLPKGEADGLMTGTGFFIADGLVVTNRHVIDAADPAKLFITSASLGKMAQVSLIAATVSAVPGEADYAVLGTGSVRAPATLALSLDAGKLTPVIAAGYPGMALLGDQGFQKLIQGDLSSAPDLNMNRGEVRSVRPVGDIVQIIHTADVLQGYSGGPLLDTCGRAIGVNTFIQVDRDQAAKLNSAQKVDTLLAFLQKKGITPALDSRACQPG
ncbi:hypothetical protein CKO38_17845 [Rhodospirillum rubrum]|uniref:S1 family peptidase n=1 Tax=Rhodospirillum rubrum TaxID=1085 RepID=UPI001906D3E1|nr:serine protease [Rhodospirillum rubrum]MBK1664831.1 hypothetical protein [Rhodospirillum rubrum]MBK1678488.1 hypothetical protein [Rhodospirillum rubrum]